MREHKQIIKDAGGPEVVHAKLGLSLHTVRSWVQRKRIPTEYWPALADIGVTSTDELVATARPRKRPDVQRAA